MAIQTLIGKRGIGDLLGGGFGTGLSKGLEELAKRKMQNLQAQNIRSRLDLLTGGGKPSPGENLTPGTEGDQTPGDQTPTDAKTDSISFLKGMPLGTPEQELKLADQVVKMQEGAKNRELKERLAKEGIAARQQDRIDTETFKAVEKWDTEASSADIEIRELEEFNRLREKGETGTPLGNALIKAGAAFIFDDDKIPTDWVLSTDAQKQIKLSANFVKTTIQSITGRKSRELLRVIEKASPNIWQKPEAQKYVADILLYEAHLKKAKQLAHRDITRESGGLRPRNIRELVDNRVAEKYEPELYQKYFPKETVLDTNTEYDGLPDPVLTDKDAEFAYKGFIWRNTKVKWVKSRRDPSYRR